MYVIDYVLSVVIQSDLMLNNELDNIIIIIIIIIKCFI